MTIIEQLEQSVSLAILGEQHNIAHISLLEPFYALLIARLASPKVYTQLLQGNYSQSTSTQATSALAEQAPSVLSASHASGSIFEQLWPQQEQRQLILTELAAMHHVDEGVALRLTTSAAELAYIELKRLAVGQFLPAFLQQQQLEIRHYLPVWAQAVLAAPTGSDIGSHTVDATHDTDVIERVTLDKELSAVETIDNSTANKVPLTQNQDDPNATINTPQTIAADTLIETNQPDDSVPYIAINEGAHSSKQINETRKLNKRRDLLIRLFLLGAAIAALALLWLFVIQPNNSTTAEPTAVETVAVVNEPEPIAVVLEPVQLLVAVDNSGSLYTCSAIIGDTALQNTLQQTLITAFAEQADICKLEVKAGVANDFAELNIGLLPSLLNLLRSAPFARLQLQNGVITIESPDEMVTQRLLTDMRTLAPTTTFTTTAPLPTLNEGVMNDNSAFTALPSSQWEDQESANSANNSNNPNSFDNFDNSNTFDNRDAAATEPSFDNNSNINTSSNSLNNNSATRLNNRPVGGMSDAEVDALANQIIVAEQLRNEARVETNNTAE